MSQKERWNFFKKSRSKCKNCFSTGHDFDECPINRGTCQEKLTQSEKEGQPCGKKHNRLLHFEPKSKKNQDHSSNQTSTQEEEGEAEK